MRHCLASLCCVLLGASALTESSSALGANALTAVTTEVDFAAAGQSQTDPALITWQPYDTFQGATLNTALWTIGNQLGALSTGATGLVMAPTALTAAGDTFIAIQTPVPVTLGQYFAVRVPFVIAAASTSQPGDVEYNFDICGVQLAHQCDSTGWVLGNNVIPPGGGPVVNGSAFFAGPTPLSVVPTTSTQGQLAAIYNGQSITSYFNDGSGWQPLGGPFTPPASWVPAGGSFIFSLGTGVTVTSPVPEPATLTLLAMGLTLLAVQRRRVARLQGL